MTSQIPSTAAVRKPVRPSAGYPNSVGPVPHRKMSDEPMTSAAMTPAPAAVSQAARSRTNHEGDCGR